MGDATDLQDVMRLSDMLRPGRGVSSGWFGASAEMEIANAAILWNCAKESIEHAVRRCRVAGDWGITIKEMQQNHNRVKQAEAPR